MSTALEHKWQKVLGYGKAVHIIITNDLIIKTACGKDVSKYELKKFVNCFRGKKCVLCERLAKQYQNSREAFDERFCIDYHY